MRSQNFSSCLNRIFPLVTVALLIVANSPAYGQFKTLHVFGKGADGVYPSNGVIADAAGNLYGSTNTGNNRLGDIFELSPPVSGGPWIETILYKFTAASGSGANGLVFDAAGNLYGTTLAGGDSHNDGMIFQLAPPTSSGGAWTFNTIYTFRGEPDGSVAVGNLIMDASGNLYGTTVNGGTCNNGAAFELSPPATQGGAWTESVLYSFGYYCNNKYSSDGWHPQAGLAFGKAGTLFGTTWNGGLGSAGTAFKLSPPSGIHTTWSEEVVFPFSNNNDGGYPTGQLVADHLGNLYGTTGYGGDNSCLNGFPGCGVVFEISPPASPGAAWIYTVLFNFTNGADGSLPIAGLIFDQLGNLYGTSSVGGPGNCNVDTSSGCGAIFKLSPPSVLGGAWTETTLYTFTGGADQGGDASGLIFGRNRKLFGTTQYTGDPNGYGTVFTVVP